MPLVLSGTGGISNGVVNGLNQDASGRVTSPFQPGFSANGTFILTSFVVNQYTTVSFNQGGHYNNSNGRFTAPVSGIYLFTATFLSAATVNVYMLWNFHKNGSTATSGWHQTYNYGTGNDSQSTGALVINLVAGDFVDVRFNSSYANVYLPAYTYFTGYLLG
jgi:hypothetical protein